MKTEFLCTNAQSHLAHKCDTARKPYKNGMKYIRYNGGEVCEEFREMPFKVPRNAIDKEIVLDVEPCSKPRMTRSDKWNKRPCVVKYWAFKDALREKLPKDFKMPEAGYHLIFYIPMPKSWSRTKREAMLFTPHQQTPDKDNLEKAFLDAVCKNDAHICDGRVSKYWAEKGAIKLGWDSGGIAAAHYREQSPFLMKNGRVYASKGWRNNQ